MAVCSSESRKTDTTKTFTGESSLAGSIVQTWTATTGILLGKTSQVEISSIMVLVSEAGCEKFQIYVKRLSHPVAISKLDGVQRTNK